MNTNNNLNKVIITGGAGFIGSNLVKKLLENGTEKILIIDDLSTGKLKNLEDFSNNKSIEIIKKRVEDIDNLNTIFEKFDFLRKILYNNQDGQNRSFRGGSISSYTRPLETISAISESAFSKLSNEYTGFQNGQS